MTFAQRQSYEKSTPISCPKLAPTNQKVFPIKNCKSLTFVIVLFFQRVDPELVFTKQERIGKGSFGEVYKGLDNRTQQVLAIKIIDLVIS